ncbi:hypothetical protein BDW69DRAFT_168652 [Aspergillus filifer]
MQYLSSSDKRNANLAFVSHLPVRKGLNAMLACTGSIVRVKDAAAQPLFFCCRQLTAYVRWNVELGATKTQLLVCLCLYFVVIYFLISL